MSDNENQRGKGEINREGDMKEEKRGEDCEGRDDNGGRFYVCMYIKGGQQVEARTHPSFFISNKIHSIPSIIFLSTLIFVTLIINLYLLNPL